MRGLKRKTVVITILLTLMSIALLPSNIAQERAPETYPTVYVKIHRIQQVDEIELEGEADWYYHVGISEDGSTYIWKHSAEPVATDTDDLIVDVTYSFTDIQEITVYVAIMLCEDDLWTDDDLADISSDESGGADDVADSIQPPSTGTYVGSYRSTYSLKIDTLTGDTTYTEEGYYKTTGDYDDSTGTDENDANLWFDIWDNYDPPVANAGPDKEVYTGELVNFDGGHSYASSGSSLTKYQWDFNNDGVYDAEGQTTSHTYTTKGTYTVTLKVTDSLGETDADTCIVSVLNRAPTAAFTYSPTNPTTAIKVQFTDTSTDADGTIASWSWDFGDGAASSSKDPTHKYSDDGTYTVTLTITDNDGGIDSESKSITILNVLPNADFSYSPTSPTTAETVQFNDSSTDSDGTVVAWSWDFGDGYTSTVKNPTHKYAKGGTYTVKLTITDDDGSNKAITKQIVVSESIIPVISSPIVLIGIIGIIAIIIACIVVLALRKKKKKKLLER